MCYWAAGVGQQAVGREIGAYYYYAAISAVRNSQNRPLSV